VPATALTEINRKEPILLIKVGIKFFLFPSSLEALLSSEAALSTSAQMTEMKMEEVESDLKTVLQLASSQLRRK